MLLNAEARGPAVPAAIFFIFIGAYAIALFPAIFSGAVYWLMVMLVVKMLRLRRLSSVLASAIGCLASIAGMAVFHKVGFGTLLPDSQGFEQLFAIAAGCGAALALMANLFAPAGTNASYQRAQ